MDQPNNPYAPPATSDAPPAPPTTEPSRPDLHPARLLWPLLVLRFLYAIVLGSWINNSLLRFHHLGRAAEALRGYIQIGGQMLAAPLTATLGDRRSARLLLLLGLALIGAAVLALLPATSNVALAAAISSSANVSIHLVGLIVMAYLLRVVTVRGAFIVVTLEEIASNIGLSVGGLSTRLGPTISLVGAATFVLLATLMLRWIRSPEQVTVSTNVDDALARPALDGGRGVSLVLLLACFGALASVSETLSHAPIHRAESDSIYLHLATSAILLALPFLAYAKSWRPKWLLFSSMIVNVLAAMAIALTALVPSLPDMALIGSVLSRGRKTLLPLGVEPTVRQNLPLERIALWCTALYVSWTLFHLAFFQARRLDPALVLIGISAIVLTLALGSLALLRGR